MKKSVVCILVLLLFVSACDNQPAAGNNPQDTASAIREVQTGTQGVTIETKENLPPPLLYDDNELVALVEVRNRGNYDLEAQECFVQVTGYDPNIITGGFDQAHSCSEGLGVLEGKNLFNTEGSFNQIEFRSSNIQLPQGVFEYNPNLNFLSCYTYRTRANPSVCVDPLFFQVTAEQKACTPRDVGMGGGQGAPVAVTHVGVDMVGSKAIFEINVQNLGGGRVLNPFADIRSCGRDNIDYTDLDKLEYQVDMSGGSLINCNPRDGIVRLSNEQGKIVCSFDIHGSSAFETPLSIALDYGYVQNEQQQVKIIQTPR